MLKNTNPRITAILIIALIIAGTFSYVQYLINKPLKILKNYTIPKEFIHNDAKIALAWTDDNEGETLIIQSDKKEYNGFSSVDVYFSITNISKKDQDMDVVVWVGSEKVKVEEMEKVLKTQDTRNKDTNKLQITNYSKSNSNIKIQNRKDTGKSSNGYSVNDNIKSGETNYYKATIKYPPMSKGEFFIEAFGKKNSKFKIQNSKFTYGHLDPWYSSNWNYKREITINASQIATTTDSFPVLATTTLDDLKTTTNGGKVGNDNGYDIIFVDDDDSTLLNFEREYYASTTGEIVYWIKTDISSTTDKTIYMYYGNGSASDQATTTGVWDDNFVMVQHLSEIPDNTADQIKDSTSNANDGQTVTMASDDQVAGQIDGSLDFDGGSDYILRTSFNGTTAGDDYTFSSWIKPSSIDSTQNLVIDESPKIRLEIMNNKARIAVGNGVSWTIENNFIEGTTVLQEGVFYYITGYYDGINLKLFVNGIQESGNKALSITTATLNNVYLGKYGGGSSYEFPGLIDEVRISNIARTAGWIETEYNNQSDVGSFITIGSEMSNDWYSTNWKYRRQIDINSSQIATTTSDFPILATTTLAALKTTINGGKVESENGHDIIFVNLENTLLNYEREKYDSTTGEIAYWIKIDISSTTDKMIYMYYGNASATDHATTTGVWDDNYKGVWHLAETDIDNDAGDIKDSTASANNGTTYNMNTDDQVTGQVNGSLDFNGTDNYISIGNAYDGVKTISFWLKPDDLTDRMILDIDATDYIKINASGKIEPISFTSPIIYVDGTVASSTGTNWHYTVITDTTGVNASAMNISKVASSYFDGIIDEVRVSNVVRTAGWIETEYNNQSNASSFLTINSEESLKLVITTSAKTLTAGTESTAFTVQIQNMDDGQRNIGNNLTVSLSSDSSLYSFASTTGGTAISSVTIPSGSNSVNFYYTDHKIGSPTITVTAANLVLDTQQQTVQYQYRRQIILKADQIATTTDAFPVLATTTLDDLKTTTHGGKVINDNGYDIFFTDDDGTTLLNYEREKYASTTGEIVYWIKTDISSTTDKTIYMYYGGGSSSDQSNATGVWDDNYVMVQHLQETPDNTADQIKDSTSNANDGQTVTMASDDQVAGQIDGSLDFDGDNDYVNTKTVLDDMASELTIELWFRPTYIWDSSQTVNDYLFTKRNDASGNNRIAGNLSESSGTFDFWGTVNGTFFSSNSTKTSWAADTFHYVTLLINSSGAHIYVNGNYENTDASISSPPADGTSLNFQIGQVVWLPGDYNFNGIIDEVRISDTARSAGWIETEYNNQSDIDSFMTIGAAAEIFRLDITTAAKVIVAGTESTAFTVQTDHNVGADTTVNLSSDSTGTYNFAATSGGAEVSSVTIPSGTSSVDFYYTDYQEGSPTITVYATNFVSDDQQQTVQPPPKYKIKSGGEGGIKMQGYIKFK